MILLIPLLSLLFNFNSCTSTTYRTATLAPPLASLSPNPDPSCAHWVEHTPIPLPPKPGYPVRTLDVSVSCTILILYDADYRVQAEHDLALAQELHQTLGDEAALEYLLATRLGNCWLNWAIRKIRDYPSTHTVEYLLKDCADGFARAHTHE